MGRHRHSAAGPKFQANFDGSGASGNERFQTDYVLAPLTVPAGGKAETGRDGAYDFRLTDTAGQRYSLDSFASDTLLVIYFGYTTCLQACPTALDSIAAAIDGLGPPRSEVRLLFVDMDSERAAMASLRRSGVYRQTPQGTLALWAAFALGLM